MDFLWSDFLALLLLLPAMVAAVFAGAFAAVCTEAGAFVAGVVAGVFEVALVGPSSRRLLPEDLK